MQTNDSHEQVRLSESKTHSMTSVVQFVNKWFLWTGSFKLDKKYSASSIVRFTNEAYELVLLRDQCSSIPEQMTWINKLFLVNQIHRAQPV